MDTRSDRGEFYPGGDRSGGAPAPQPSDKVDRVNVGEVGESYTLKDVKNKVNQIVRVIAPAAVCMALAVVRLLSYAATAPLEDIPNTAPVVTNEEDAVAMAAVGALGAAVSNRVEAAEGSLQAEIAGATNAVVQAALRAAEAESNRVESTYAKRSEIPAAPDLEPYALKSELPTDYLTEGDITNFATRAWISGQGYATEAGMNARIDAQDLELGAATNRLWAAHEAESNRLNKATNKLWQTARSESNRLDRTAEEIRNEIAALELTGGMTRLWSSDATTYQDATGVVWQVQVVTGLWTVVHSWTTTGLNWQGPWWWGAEDAGEDYYEGPGWYISGSTFTTMRISENPYEKEIVWQWSYWDEQEHSITTTCSRTVQWFTNAVKRVAYTNDLATIVPGNYETVSNRAMTATNYTDEVAEDIRQNYIPISGGPIFSSVELFLNELLHEQRMLRFELPDGTSADAQSFVGSSQITNQGAVAAATAMAVRKQDALPYPTNAIPYAAISGAPSGGGQEWRVVNYDVEVDEISFVTNGMANLIFIGGEMGGAVSTNGWPDGASMFVRGQFSSETSYTFGSNVRLVGYGTWPRNNFQSVWWRSGATIYVNILLEE